MAIGMALGDCQWDALAPFVHSDDDELTGLRPARDARRFHLEARDVGRHHRPRHYPESVPGRQRN